MYTIHEDLRRYRAIIALSKILSRKFLKTLGTIFIVLTFFALFAFVILHLVGQGPSDLFLGLSLVFLSFWLTQILLYTFFNSFYFYGINSVLGKDDEKTEAGVDFEVAKILLKNEKDITKSFCTSQLGASVLLRAGADLNILGAFLKNQRPIISTGMVALSKSDVFDLVSLGKYLFQIDPAFNKMIKEQGITEDVFFGSLNWLHSEDWRDKQSERWWGKDNLAKTQGIGREWSYGTAYILQKYSRSISTSSVFSTLTQSNTAFTEEKLKEIEVSLARAKASNVLVIGEAGVGVIDLIMEVDRRMKTGKAITAVENQSMVLLDTNLIFATHKVKQDLEVTLLRLFTEAAKAGNIIIVIENLSTFVRTAEAMGTFIPELLDPFLASNELHVIATDTPGAYHTFIEPLGSLSRRFAEVLIDEPNLQSVTRTLQSVTPRTERMYKTMFTYSALQTITETADRYLVEGVMPDKAIELMIDIATRAGHMGVAVVYPNYVYTIISEKTGIPVGPIDEKEKNVLLNLEERLHERVIGQRDAIDAIARTMRRARAGIQSGNKPIGSFLFLGPSGVGKTETAKALAYTFFGDEKKMHRIDMSEFSGVDSLQRMIGDGVSIGILPKMLKEYPYAVLLLDEFEKGSKSVHDIFLQILDEGVFTDARGEKINARNTIIIATSNAGSQLILKTMQQRKELSTLNQKIIDHIIEEGTYRPELLNRFDSTIIFEPLEIDEQSQIAGLMLNKLYKRIESRGYEIEVSKDLLDILVEKGYNPQFGARPMMRILQDVVEEKIAQKIIRGEVQKGEKVILQKSDFSEEELAVV